MEPNYPNQNGLIPLISKTLSHQVYSQTESQDLPKSNSDVSSSNGHSKLFDRSLSQLDQTLSSLSGPAFKPQVQVIFLDLTFKNYTSQQITEDTTASEICKLLKTKYSQNFSALQTLNQKDNQQRMTTPSTSSSQLEKNPAFRSTAVEKRSDKDLSGKDEVGLFMINTRAISPVLFIRKLAPNDNVLKLTKNNAEVFRKDQGERFKLVFCKQSEIDFFLKQRGIFQSHFEEENQVVSQLGKSIINNKNYERKGKLLKRSLNSDKFKERQFVLDKDQLFYYKNEKQSTRLLSFMVEDKNFNLIMLNNAEAHILDNFPKQKFCFQIINENRKYILGTKSQYDLVQWVVAIQGQIKLSQENKKIMDVNTTIINKEKEIAQHDMQLVQKIFKPNNSLFNPVQPILLDYINDPFISELLPHLTKYMSLSKDKQYQRQALEKGKDIMNQLSILQKKAQKAMQSKNSSSNLESGNAKEEAKEDAADDHKKYKDLLPEKKIQCLFTQEEYKQIEKEFQVMLESEKKGELKTNAKMFNSILQRIQRVLRYNYLDDFYAQKKVELITIPHQYYKANLPPLEFSVLKQDLKGRHGRQANIFETIMQKKIVKDLQQVEAKKANGYE